MVRPSFSHHLYKVSKEIWKLLEIYSFNQSNQKEVIEMKVRSFVAGTANGITDSMRWLDKSVSDLGPLKIHSVTDTFLEDKELKFSSGGPAPGPRIVRVVVFE